MKETFPQIKGQEKLLGKEQSETEKHKLPKYRVQNRIVRMPKKLS